MWTLAFRPLRSLFRAELAQLDPLVDESKPVHPKDISLYLIWLQALNTSWQEIDSKQLLGLAVLIDEAVLRAFDRVRTLEIPLVGFGAVSQMLHDAKWVANSESVLERISTFCSRLEGRKDELCSYCRKREQDFEYAAALSGRVETGRTPTFNGTTIHYRVRSIPILRCASCAKLHDYLSSMGYWAWGAALVMSILYVIFFVPEGYPLLQGLLLAGAVGGSFRRVLSWFVTPKGDCSYANYKDTKAYSMLRDERYGQFEYDFGLKAWQVAAAKRG